MTKKSKKFKTIIPVSKFEVCCVYMAQNGKRYKVVDRSDDCVHLAPLKGCVVYIKDTFVYSVRIYSVTKSEQVNVAERGEYVWLSSLKKVTLPSKKKAVSK